MLCSYPKLNMILTMIVKTIVLTSGGECLCTVSRVSKEEKSTDELLVDGFHNMSARTSVNAKPSVNSKRPTSSKVLQPPCECTPTKLKLIHGLLGLPN